MQDIMNILLCNDDGYLFRGIVTLKKILSKKHNVFLAAPIKDLSGTSQAITLTRDVNVKIRDERTFTIDGFPADCVNLAIQGSLFSEKIDLVISGINKGVNMGQDIWYSGTVGAVRHAFIHGFSGIAVSCDHASSQDEYTTVANFMSGFIDSNILERPFLLNINYPTHKEISGIQWTKLGKRIYQDSYSKLHDSQGQRSFKFNGSGSFHIAQEDTDFKAYQDGYISITPLTLDATDYHTLKTVKFADETIGKK